MMRVIWGLRDTENDILMCLFEAENLLVRYRDEHLLRPWFDQMTTALPDRDYLPGDEYVKQVDDAGRAERDRLLDIGYERWRIDEINAQHPRFVTEKYQLWSSVPPNADRLIIHYDAG